MRFDNIVVLRSPAETLYITFDGVLEPLGYSQVARTVMGLGLRGREYTLLSVERSASLEDRARVDELRCELENAGVRWHPIPFEGDSSRKDVASKVGRTIAAALRLCREREIGLVHARSYMAGAIAYGIKRALGIPYLFDIRGYWIDERADFGHWFTNPWVFRSAKRMERELFRECAAVVSLTQLAADDITSGRFVRWDQRKPVRVIPTCADFDEFVLRDPTQVQSRDRTDAAAGLDGKLVLAYVGAISAHYFTEEAMELFRRVHERRSDAHLLCLTHQREPMLALANKVGVPADTITVVTARHQEMAAWLSRVDWSFLMLRANYAKRASMPTKFGELLAAGVRPIHHGCNSEVASWVSRCGTGITLPDLSEAELELAAEHIATSSITLAQLRTARELAFAHFSLASGLDRYEVLLDELASVAKR